MTPDLTAERRLDTEIRRAHQLERCRARARRRLAAEFPERYREILAEEKSTLPEPQYEQRATWTTGELAKLRLWAPLGARAIAEGLGRSIASVQWKAKTERISLRRPGRSDGHILGQARRARLKGTPLEALRADVLNGNADPERMARRKRLVSVCSACGIRPQETEEGWCLVCDLKALTRSYEAEKAVAAAQRENDVARQRAHRAKEEA